MTDDRTDLDNYYLARRVELATDRLAGEYQSEGEGPVEPIELLRRLARTGQQPGRARHGQPGAAEALDGLLVLADLERERYRLQMLLIRAATQDGASWPQIGAALGLTGDGARARWNTGRSLVEGGPE